MLTFSQAISKFGSMSQEISQWVYTLQLNEPLMLYDINTNTFILFNDELFFEIFVGWGFFPLSIIYICSGSG